MDCKKIMTLRDDLLDSALSAAETAAIARHAASCPQCSDMLRRDAELIAALRSMPAPAPSPDLAVRALAAARSAHDNHQQRHYSRWIGAALAACLVVWIMIGLPGKTLISPDPAGSGLAMVALKLHEEKTVTVVVNAPQDLIDAAVTIHLPKQLEMSGFPASSEIKWTTTLRKGKNLLRLPLTARGTGNAEIVTRIDHLNRSKVLRLEMQIDDVAPTGAFSAARYIV